jgi:hypothetical protein
MPKGLLGTTTSLSVVDGDDRRPTDLCSKPLCRLIVGARESQGLVA